MKKGEIILAFGVLVFSVMLATMVSAQESYPTRAVEVVSPNAPGGGLDFALQLFKPRVEKVLGKPLIINYRSGAGGIQGTLYAKDAKPDGYTLMAATVSTLVLPTLTKKGATYGMDDFTPICNLTSIPHPFLRERGQSLQNHGGFHPCRQDQKDEVCDPRHLLQCSYPDGGLIQDGGLSGNPHSSNRNGRGYGSRHGRASGYVGCFFFRTPIQKKTG